MNLKKGLLVTTVSLSLFGFSNTVSAEESKQDPDIIVNSDSTSEFKAPLNGDNVSLFKAPVNTSEVKVYKPTFSNNYAVAYSKSTVKEDYIYARARAFKRNGTLFDSQSSSAKNATSVSTKKAVSPSLVYGGDYAIGNHTYQLKGYNDIHHETKAYW